jgi:hypothetical protein
MHVKTLSVRIVEMHTGQALAKHTKKELDDFSIGDATFFSTHDGVANVMKCSRLLGIESVIHLLSTVDSMFNISEVVDLVKSVSHFMTLHFEGCILTEESLSDNDRDTTDRLLQMIADVKGTLTIDERYRTFGDDDDDVASGVRRTVLSLLTQPHRFTPIRPTANFDICTHSATYNPAL